MGIDFIQKTKKSFLKSLDRQRARRNTPDLFIQDPSESPRSYLLNLKHGHQLKKDDQVLVCLGPDNQVLAMDGSNEIGEFQKPPDELREALQEFDACGTVAIVYEDQFMAEITVC